MLNSLNIKILAHKDLFWSIPIALLAIFTLSGCSQLASTEKNVELTPSGAPLGVSATPSAGVPFVVSATPSFLLAENTATSSGIPFVVTATSPATISALATKTLSSSLQVNSDLIADCQQFKDDPPAFTITQYSGDVVNYAKWKDTNDSPRVMGLYSIELDTRGNNPSNEILDEVHGLVVCYDRTVDARSAFDHQLRNGQSESLDDNTELTEGWGNDPDKYIIWVRYRNLVLQVKGLRNGATGDSPVIQATMFQALDALENITALDLVPVSN